MLTGSELRFDIWKEKNDHVNWEKYLEYFRREPEFDKEKSSSLIEIYTFLRKELGKDYLERCYRDGKNLVNSWLWSRGSHYSELKWLTEAMQYFKSKDCNYVKLCGRLRSNEECNRQGIPFLIAGDSLRKAGFDVVFEPDVDFKRKPDLKIINAAENEIIYGEVSQLNDSDAKENSSYAYHLLMDFFHLIPPIIPFAGKIHRFVAEEEINELKEFIIRTKQKALDENAFVCIQKEETNGLIEFGVAHPDKINELEVWETEKRFRGVGQLLGLPLNFDYTPRVLSKIVDEVKQLPSNYPGIIYIPLPALYFFFGLLEPLKMVDQVKDLLKNWPHIVGVCMYCHLGKECEPVEELFEFNYFERKMVHGNIQQDVFFIINNDFNFEGLLADSLKKLYNSFKVIYR